MVTTSYSTAGSKQPSPNQTPKNREDLAAAVFDEDKDTNQGVINACLVLLAYCTTQKEFNDLVDDEGLIPLGD